MVLLLDLQCDGVEDTFVCDPPISALKRAEPWMLTLLQTAVSYLFIHLIRLRSFSHFVLLVSIKPRLGIRSCGCYSSLLLRKRAPAVSNHSKVNPLRSPE